MLLASLDRQVDELYQLPPAEFTAARNALAKTLTGDEARRVRALKKPSAVAWAVNQIFWKARPPYDALMKAGQALRAAQISALKGRKADVRAVVDAHRKALADAVKRARQFASHADVNPDVDQLARMLETLSLAAEPSADAGRFVDVIGPAGFGALSGVTPVTPPLSSRDEVKQRKAKEEEKRQRDAEARLRTAEAALDRARDRAESARRALNRADADVAAAERAVADAQSRVLNS